MAFWLQCERLLYAGPGYPGLGRKAVKKVEQFIENLVEIEHFEKSKFCIISSITRCCFLHEEMNRNKRATKSFVMGFGADIHQDLPSHFIFWLNVFLYNQHISIVMLEAASKM